VHRLLAVVIALLLGGAVAAAIVKDKGSTPVVISSPSPEQTYTFPGPVPTAASSETPVIPADTASATPTVDSLANTGGGSIAPAAALTLLVTAAGGVAVLRTSRRAT